MNTCALLILMGLLSPVLQNGDLELIGKIRIDVPEPSDLCFTPDGKNLIVVSDKGRLYRLDLKGNILERASYKGSDFEGVCVRGDLIYAIDETMRKIVVFDGESLKFKRSRQYTYLGAMNRGWETIIYDSDQDRFLAITEKLPALIFEFDDDLDEKGTTKIEDIREVSGGTYHNGSLWILSDEDRTIYRVTPNAFKVKESWKIPVLNPEGIAFSPDGSEIWVVSDDRNTIYMFKTPAEF